MTESDKLLLERLDSALNTLLAARVLVGGLPNVDIPHEGLGATVAADDGYQTARSRFSEAFAALMDVLPDPGTRSLALELEAAANTLAVKGSEVGWTLGVMAGSTSRPGER